MRNCEAISESEFRNVVGRAGRAYVDIEGLVVYPMFEDHGKRRAAWAELIGSSKGREMESGILRLLMSLLLRMAKKIGTNDVGGLMEYVAGQGGWDFPVLANERTITSEEAAEKWPRHLTSLDTAIFSLLGDAQVPDNEVEAKLDEVLTSSLLVRRLMRTSEETQAVLLGTLKARARFIWASTTAAQRRGYFLAGIGLAAGQALDGQAQELERLLLDANEATKSGDQDRAVLAIIGFADIALKIPPFTPRRISADWKLILERWLRGHPVPKISADDPNDAVSLIEHAFVYNLPWAMEAVRVRAEAHHAPDPLSEDVTLADYDGASAVAAVETGTLLVSASILIKAGFASRLGAISAVDETTASFDSPTGMRLWLALPDVRARRDHFNWPTDESHDLWREFTALHGAGRSAPWTARGYNCPVTWFGVPPPPGAALRLGGGLGEEDSVFTADFKRIGKVLYPFNRDAVGLTIATANGSNDAIYLEYLGPNDHLTP